MAEWYMGVLGIYPLCQSKNEYVKFNALAEEIDFEGRDRYGY